MSAVFSPLTFRLNDSKDLGVTVDRSHPDANRFAHFALFGHDIGLEILVSHVLLQFFQKLVADFVFRVGHQSVQEANVSEN